MAIESLGDIVVTLREKESVRKFCLQVHQFLSFEWGIYEFNEIKRQE